MQGFKSKAFSAQDTLIQIENKDIVSGVSHVITSITKANPPLLTSTAAPATGTAVAVEGTGFASVDGKTWSVQNMSPTTFKLIGANTAAETATPTAVGTAKEVVWADICEAKTFNGFDGQSAEIDVTTLCSEAKEYIVGLQDFGNFNFTANLVPGDPGLDECEVAKADGLARWFRVILPQAMGMYVFTAFVRQKTITGGVGAGVDTSVVLRISGEPTYIVAGP